MRVSLRLHPAEFPFTTNRIAMAHIILRPGWQGREKDVTPEPVYRDRRRFLKELGLGAVGALAGAGVVGCSGESRRDLTGAPPPAGPLETIPADAPRAGYPAPRTQNIPTPGGQPADYLPERPVTDRMISSSYNNYYEFKHSGDLKEVWPLTGAYDPFPETIEVGGLVENPFRMDIGELIESMELEERIYRFRCVEAWAITVPWTGFPLRTLIERAGPLPGATHVRFTSIARPRQMPGIPSSSSYYDWPYYEGLRLEEAMNPLAFVATGMYGEPLPKQNGSPMRLAIPWKYGYKGPKAVHQVTLVDEQPPTFWNDLQPAEYGFLSNVNPYVPHPRWSQASEELVETGERVPTQIFNGYAEWVGGLYPDEPRRLTGPLAR